MARRRFNRWRSAFKIDCMHEGTIFRANVNWSHRKATMLEGPFGSQQKPGANRIELTNCTAIYLNPRAARCVQLPQGEIKTAGLADNPKTADDQA